MTVTASGAAALHAEDVVVRYGQVRALDGVSLDVDDLAIGLLGANGAGKSTLMKALLGLVEPERGQLSILGIDTDHAAELRRRIGYMPEHDCLPTAMAARDLVVHLGELRGLPRRAAVLRASEVLFQVGLEEERSRTIGTFSTGMKQRTKLAQALVHAPELVVLDEPTNGLDPAGREEMLTLVRRLSHDLGIRVLLSSHVLEDVERTCDSVVVLRDGVVVSAGSISDIAGGDIQRLRVRVSGDAAAFAARLVAHGVAAESHDGTFVVDGTTTVTLDAVRDAALEAGVGLRELVPERRTLEDAVIGAME
jgi:ABC-2 type transport system ATP-binding protein